MEKSSLSNLPLKIIANISKLCIEEGLEYYDPYDDFENNMEILQRSSSWASQNPDNNLDLEFICKFLIENEPLLEKWIDEELKFNEISQDLIIPEPSKFKIFYEQWGPATYTEKYKSSWFSYDKEWVEPSFNESTNQGTWSYYDGDYLEHETDNWEPSDERITSIILDTTIKESVNPKVLVENTKELIKKVDRKSLIQLRDLINQHLSL